MRALRPGVFHQRSRTAHAWVLEHVQCCSADERRQVPTAHAQFRPGASPSAEQHCACSRTHACAVTPSLSEKFLILKKNVFTLEKSCCRILLQKSYKIRQKRTGWHLCFSPISFPSAFLSEVLPFHFSLDLLHRITESYSAEGGHSAH